MVVTAPEHLSSTAMTDAMTTRIRNRRATRSLVALAAACLLLASCGSADGEEEGEPERRGALPVLGRSFVLAEVTDAGEPVEIADGSKARLDFDDDGVLSGNGGCNDFTADVDQARLDDGRLVATELSMDAAECDSNELMEQEASFASLLTDGSAWRMVVEDLVLRDGDRELRFEDESTVKPDRDFEETMWVLDTLIYEDVPQNSPDDASASMQFRADGSVELDAGCNTGSGSWTLEDDQLTIDGIALTRSSCFDIRADLEEVVLRRIDEAPLEVIVEGDRLTLMADAGNGMSFVAEASAESGTDSGESEG